jgi:hypothetical protein
MSRRMSKQTRLRLQKLLTFLSILVAIFATVLWYNIRSSGGENPLWLLGLLGYAWTFVAFLSINTAARWYSRKYRNRT